MDHSKKKPFHGFTFRPSMGVVRQPLLMRIQMTPSRAAYHLLVEVEVPSHQVGDPQADYYHWDCVPSAEGSRRRGDYNCWSWRGQRPVSPTAEEILQDSVWSGCRAGY